MATKLVCCEGGPVVFGCYHDHCTGPKLNKEPIIKNTKEKKNEISK